MVDMIKKHLERIKWRISRGGWKSNQTDLDALNGIIEYANNEEERNFRSNPHLAKLYIYLYTEFLRHYDCTVYEPHAEKAIQYILKADLATLVDNLTYTINQQNLYSELALNGFVFDHPRKLKKEAKEKNLKIIESVKGEKFTNESVMDNVTAMIKTALQITDK